MTLTPCRATLPLLALFTCVALIVAACAANPSPSPSAPATRSGVPNASTSPVPPASSQPSSGEPAGPSASAAGTLCSVTAQTGILPSDRLVDLAITATSTQDLVTFVFAPPGAPTPAGTPRGTLDAVRPPFSFAGSGQEIQLLGQHAVQVRFSAMTLATESGEATYQGPGDAKPNLPALREAIQYDASEGIVGWYIGYDGPGCVSLSRNGNDVTVAIAHPDAPAG